MSEEMTFPRRREIRRRCKKVEIGRSNARAAYSYLKGYAGMRLEPQAFADKLILTLRAVRDEAKLHPKTAEFGSIEKMMKALAEALIDDEAFRKKVLLYTPSGE